jgi:hypothetical protein
MEEDLKKEYPFLFQKLFEIIGDEEKTLQTMDLVVNKLCPMCWENYKKCQCWNDE